MKYALEEIHVQIARLLPVNGPIKLLDLGCCTELEYGMFIRYNPQIEVTGIEEEEKLKKLLKEKTGKRVEHLRLIYGDYFSADLGVRHYDVVLSAMELEERSRKNTLTLYKKIHKALDAEGIYIEQGVIQDRNKIVGSISNAFSKQISLLLESGFRRVEKAWYRDNAIIIKAIK
ncbi:methyltransferase domain-containing protein [[Clostridium] polysaccharolyticum]|jgi:cyclopropane fatty-acyl-phospholipid synthase-like methyltransferase|uniref:Methyltransferase domain-containing protein n=1 Tax=[Clostridium] polysaccharolyticum TaxID=29364 RepID=A0A1H9YPN7_9FIRM|nr:methyltransferase domain-containing protein [[Clostridium] polysaccharolyticum]SES70444.1 Methyltransferase domain-containing protein [[Clostridium] polysaccharolyticum]